MRTSYCLVLIGAIALVVACTSQQETAPAGPVPIGTIREVMHSVVSANAEALFNAVAITVTEAGMVEREPRTDEEWDALSHNAFTLVESTELLLVPGRRVAKPEEENTSASPTELPPIKIQEKIGANQDLWAKHVSDLKTVALQAHKITLNRDKKALFEIGETIDKTCESCHLEFWYPDEKPLESVAPRQGGQS